MTPYRLEVPNRAEYPRDAILAGMAAAGYTADADATGLSMPLVTWSPWLHTARDAISRIWPGPIIVVENGWLQPIEGQRYWSVCLWGWNGTGQWSWENDHGNRLLQHITPLMRKYGGIWEDWSWSNPDGPLVFVQQRGHAEDVRTMPKNYVHEMPGVVVRTKDDPVPIDEYLVKAMPRGIMTWSSAAASWALLFNIPVVYSGPSIWCWELASRRTDAPARDFKLRRNKKVAVMSRLAWSQWTLEEIASGEPFKRLLLPA